MITSLHKLNCWLYSECPTPYDQVSYSECPSLYSRLSYSECPTRIAGSPTPNALLRRAGCLTPNAPLCTAGCPTPNALLLISVPYFVQILYGARLCIKTLIWSVQMANLE